MGISPADRKFDVDIFTSKFDQNRPMGTRDKGQSVEGYIYQKIVAMFHNRSYQFLPYLVAHTLCELQDAMTGNLETLVGHEEAPSGQSEA